MDAQSDTQKDRESLVSGIVAAEWDFFQQTRNAGGRASCQDKPGTFGVMRRSQFLCWSTEALASYARDLEDCKARGANPVAAKYAYMMERTHPEEYREIAGQLPPVSAAKKAMADQIAAINISWQLECDRRYPILRSGGRPSTAERDSAFVTSFETYLRGELYSYSDATLALLLRDTLKAKEEGRSFAEENLDHMAQSMGFDSARALEERAAARRR